MFLGELCFKLKGWRLVYLLEAGISKYYLNKQEEKHENIN